MAIKLTEHDRELLKNSSLTSNLLVFSPMTSEDYARVKKILTAMGIKWDSRKKGHPMTDKQVAEWNGLLNKVDGDPSAPVMVADPKKDMGQFFTPPHVAHEMIRMSGFLHGPIRKTLGVLDPSCGAGNLLVAAAEHLKNKAKEIHLYGYEIDSAHADDAAENVTRAVGKNLMFRGNVLCNDFFKVADPVLFDLILMNPPFLRNTWQKHLVRALDFAGDTIVIVCPAGATFTKTTVQALEKANISVVEARRLPEDTFVSEGTKVRTQILVLKKKKKA